jgi:hypothetical protein
MNRRDDVAATTRLVRGGKGASRIHLSSCRYARGRVFPWNWAEGRSDYEWVDKAWLHPCRSCLPDLAALQDELRAKHKAKEATCSTR